MGDLTQTFRQMEALPPCRTDISFYTRRAYGIDEDSLLTYIEAFTHPKAEWEITAMQDRIAQGGEDEIRKRIYARQKRLGGCMDALMGHSFKVPVTDAVSVTSEYNRMVRSCMKSGNPDHYVRNNAKAVRDDLAGLKYKTAIFTETFGQEMARRGQAMNDLREAVFESLWLVEAARESGVQPSRPVRNSLERLQKDANLGIERLKIFEGFGRDLQRGCRHLEKMQNETLPKFERKIDEIIKRGP